MLLITLFFSADLSTQKITHTAQANKNRAAAKSDTDISASSCDPEK